MATTPTPVGPQMASYIFPCTNLKRNQPLFNDGLPSLIFMPHKSDTAHIKEDGQTSTFGSAWVCCGVIQSTYWEVPEELEYILVIRFKPSSFYSLFNSSPSVFLSHPICNLEQVADEHWMQVFDEMYRKQTPEERIDFLDEAFASAMATNGHFPHLLTQAMDYIDGQKGNTNVSAVLGYLGKGVNTKWLHRNFVKYVGISPKKYISLQRFAYAYAQYNENKTGNLLDITPYSGYYDYNHFFKDFKRYIGIAPSRYTWG